MKVRPKFIKIVLSLVFVVCLVWVFVMFGNEFYKMKNELAESKNQINFIQQEKKLDKEKLELTKMKLSRLTAELMLALKKIKIGNEKIMVLQREVDSLSWEKMRLEAKLNSLKDLKEAIKQVKFETRRQRLQEIAMKRNIQKKVDAEKLASGNRGYIVKDGISIYKAFVKIDVRAAD